MNNTARLARLARTATARTRATYAAAAGFLPRSFRLSRINGPEGATNVCLVVRCDGPDRGVCLGHRERLTAGPAKFSRATRYAARPVQTLGRD